ncbi:MAG: energy transducer TonB [Bacteroidales bacterium]|nr:energy transducer TonB [Bacteroidales bacterium]
MTQGSIKKISTLSINEKKFYLRSPVKKDKRDKIIWIMLDHHQKKRFLKLPKYTGGNKAFREFIAENLRYPESALQAKVEGFVIVEYDVHDNGDVDNPRILKGLGYGCDEEALRVVSLLRFEKVKNRGVRVKMTSKTTINFHLPKSSSISYTFTTSNKRDKPEAGPKKKNESPVIYNYTIQL